MCPRGSWGWWLRFWLSLPRLLVLDEMDQLDSKAQDVLYTIFEWPYLPNSRLCLIGIANALDLTDRILPRLRARPRCHPQLLHFPPYSREELVAIVQDRLTQVKQQKFEASHRLLMVFNHCDWSVDAHHTRLQPTGSWTLRLFSSVPGRCRQCRETHGKPWTSAGTDQKVSTLSSDRLFGSEMLMFLHLCRRAVEVVESDERKKAFDQRGEARGEFCCRCSLCTRRPKCRKAQRFLSCVQRRRSAFLRWPECSLRFTATAWHLKAAAQTLRVSPFSRSCWSAACCCSYAAGRPKRSSWGRWDASSCSSVPGFSHLACVLLTRCLRARFFSSTRCTAACVLGGRCLRWVRESVCHSAVCWRAEESLH